MARHLALVDRELTDVLDGTNRRLIITMPPRHGKTHLCGEYFPPLYLGTHPEHNVMYCSATDNMAETKSRAARTIFEEWGPRLWGRGVAQTPRGASHWKLAGSPPDCGELFAAGIGSGRIMGQGAQLLLIDDFFRNLEDAMSATTRQKHQEWYLSTSSTRLMPGGAVVIIATRWHSDDLIGFVEKMAAETGEQWRTVRLPAIAEEEDDPIDRQPGEPLWPSMWPLERLSARRDEYSQSGYPWMWESLYQCRPPEVISSEWPGEYFESIWYDDDELPENLEIQVLALDPSKGKTEKADFSAIVHVMRDPGGDYWVDADMSQQRDCAGIVTDSLRWARQIKPDYFGVESNNFQELLGDQLLRDSQRMGFRTDFRKIHNHENKIIRIRRLTLPLAEGRIHLRRGRPGTQLLYEQLRGFPNHLYFDGPDALEMGIRLADVMRTARGNKFEPYTVRV